MAAVAVDYHRLARRNPAAEGFQGEIGALAFILITQKSLTEKDRPSHTAIVDSGLWIADEESALSSTILDLLSTILDLAPLLANELGQRVGAARVGGAVLAEWQRAFWPVNA